MLNLFTLLYADDTILLSESITDLQNMLNILNNYCKLWHLTVNAGLDQPDVMLNLFTLLYADDTILLSESITDLQNMLNILNNYCKLWHLTVNAEKNKIVVFSKGKIRNLPNFMYGDATLEVQHSYTYLGTLINYNSKYGQAMK